MPPKQRGPFHHIDLNVRDLGASSRVYGLILEFLGYKLVRNDGKGREWDLERGGQRMSLGLRACAPELADHVHNRYAPGLHHLAWQAESRDAVDRLHCLLLDKGVRILDAPALYPEYSEGYYAVFFEDPDGMKLEVLHED